VTFLLSSAASLRKHDLYITAFKQYCSNIQNFSTIRDTILSLHIKSLVITLFTYSGSTGPVVCEWDPTEEESQREEKRFRGDRKGGR
jgi:hypothetical protein